MGNFPFLGVLLASAWRTITQCTNEETAHWMAVCTDVPAAFVRFGSTTTTTATTTTTTIYLVDVFTSLSHLDFTPSLT